LQLPDETLITELTITPDGRIFVFGLSREVLDLLKNLNCCSDDIKQRMDYVDKLEQSDQSRLTTGQGSSENLTPGNFAHILSKESEQ
jgi:hypothetical protein